MANNRTTLPHASTHLFLIDGGIETTLIFKEGFNIPHFAAFDLLKDEKGYNIIRDYYKKYLNIAKNFNTNFILESPTWRANPDWIKKIGYSKSAISKINTKAIQLLIDLKNEFAKDLDLIVISGCIGPRGDGYKPKDKMSIEEAQEYHSKQIGAFKHTPLNMISAKTMVYVEEAIGIVRAAGAVNLPVVISFTVEKNGKLPTGMSLREAIKQVDKSVKEPPLYFMINCAHPTHFINELLNGKNESWPKRIKGLRANASCKSHAELNNATELDRGNPQELGDLYKKLKETFDHLTVFGGCCGTDTEHIIEIISQLKKPD